ncbi:kinase domain protein, partial [Cooperia oncophora]
LNFGLIVLNFSSPIKLNSEFHLDVVNRNSVYKERFPKAKVQMEEKLAAFVAEHAPLSGGSSTGDNDTGQDGVNNRRSMVLETETSTNRTLLRLIGDGATRFLHHQIVEVASDCLARSRDETISCSYFCEMSQRLDETLNEAQIKTSPESFAYLSKLVKQLLMIVSRPARLLECLEFDPDEFYHLLEEAEGVVREQLGSGTARVPDLPQYIIGKLGLDRDPLMDVDPRAESPPNAAPSAAPHRDDEMVPGHSGKSEGTQQRAPREDDFETIRLVSNGAYGAVYLVRHRETRQRFALKKMNKQTLVLRNQVDQVFAERDILTMTDNPFVVSFYGSFETKHHLCMLMEYVEGGDCAALLKSAGTLPIDLAKDCAVLRVSALICLLITAMGHIKLTDFGLSKIGLMNRTTLVAEGFENAIDTQQVQRQQLVVLLKYIAPEVILLRQGYGKPVDWWALGVILYEFLVGCVPFFGDSPEDLFSKKKWSILMATKRYRREAEDLIQGVCLRNPDGRLEPSIRPPTQLYGGHAVFFAITRLTTTLFRAKKLTRADRYNHDAESCGEEEAANAVAAAAPMFHSFSTASPRHSIVAVEQIPPPQTVSVQTPQSKRSRKPSSTTQSSEDQSITDLIDEKECPIPSAMLLRRRFSAQRQANVSTSSSGTTGTGCLNTACSSTDSSMDSSHVSTIIVGMDARKSPLPRFAISCDPSEEQHHHSPVCKELSPVDEAVRFRSHSPSPLQLVIPTTSAPAQQASSSSNDTCYVVSTGQVSPGAVSASSVSSYDGTSSHVHHVEQLSPAQPLDKPPITIRKGPFGFGFTLKSVRVYLGEHSDYYTIEHIVTAVVEGSPAYEAGLRSDDLITAVNGQPVHNLTHPQLMHRLLSYGNELSLKVTPLASTSIKEGAPRKTLGKLAKKKPKRPQRRVPLDKKPRKPSSLLRRLSGKRAANDIVPGSSSQKQTFMPRSVSSQDGAILGGPPTTTCPPSSSTSSGSGAMAGVTGQKSVCHKRLSDVGLREENQSPLVSSRPSSLRGLKQPPPLTTFGPGTSSTSVNVVKLPTSPIPVSPLARSEHSDAGPIVTRSPSPSSGNKFIASGRSFLRMLHRDEKH